MSIHMPLSLPETSHPTKALAEDYLLRFRALLETVDVDALVRIGERLDRARAEGATIFLAGNGGSAATASHWANDLGKATKGPGRPPIRVISLTDNVSWLTALANDEGYERIFTGQLENFARRGDLLVVISASGNSPNLVAAVGLARRRGVDAIGLLGFDGGVLKPLLDDCLLVRTEAGAYGSVESIHSFAAHVLTACLAPPPEAVRSDG